MTDDEVQAVNAAAVEVGHKGAQVDAVAVRAQMWMLSDEVFAQCIAELEELSSRRFQPYPGWPLSLAMRAWATGDKAAARRARQIAATATYRSSNWTPVEILLEHLGLPLDTVKTQWLEPYEDVRRRWLDVLRAIVERARVTQELAVGNDG